MSDSRVRTAMSEVDTNGCSCQTLPMSEVRQNPCVVGRVSSLEEEGHKFGAAVGKVVAVGLSETLSSEGRSGVSHGGTWRNGIPGRGTARLRPPVQTEGSLLD